jgi:hypothetical protein
MNLVHLGTDYGGFTLDLDRVPEEGFVIDAGVGTDCSFAEALHAARPKLRFILIDHTEESRDFILKVRGYPWMDFIHAAIAPVGVESLTMFRHKTSGSESCSRTHGFINPRNTYTVPTVHLADLVEKHRPCVVKLDIESAEYGCIRECIGIPQVCVEFHHRMDTGFTAEDTDRIIRDFLVEGYEVGHKTPTDEYLLVRR